MSNGYYWSKGTLRRNTNENVEYVIRYLNTENIKYKLGHFSNSVIEIINNNNNRYGYTYTTGRWCSYKKGKEIKHYHSKGIQDFVINYLNKF